MNDEPRFFAMESSWISIDSMRDSVATEKADATELTPRWNQQFCFPPSPIAMLRAMASNLVFVGNTPSTNSNDAATTVREGALGKFHVVRFHALSPALFLLDFSVRLKRYHFQSPLTEGTIVRRIEPSSLLAECAEQGLSLSVELDISLNDWEGEGVYNPRDFVSRSTISSLDDSSNLLVEADRYRWIGSVQCTNRRFNLLTDCNP